MSTDGTQARSGSGGSRAATRSFTCPQCGKVHPSFVSRCPETGNAIDPAFKMEGEILEGKYRVGKAIAKGGMGVIYEGVHTALGRKVAVKFLLAEHHRSERLIARFQNEARLAAAVGHRNIVDILDLGVSARGVHYIVMEYLDGKDLADILDASCRLPVPVAVGFTLQILGALRAVHEQGIIHRDLKPENVFVLGEPGSGMTVKILDFGISRLGRNDPGDIRLTHTGAVFGTPGYMAPEQARGSKDIDRRTDIYAVGVMLYEMLTGMLPFDAENYNTMIIAITTEEPPAVETRGVDLPEGLSGVVMKAIARDPGDRFASAGEFMEALLPHADLPASRRSTTTPGDRPRGVGMPSGRPITPVFVQGRLGRSSPDQDLRATVRPGPAPRGRDSVLDRDIEIVLDEPSRRGSTPYPEAGASGWDEPLPQDMAISLNGWVAPASLPPPRPGMSSTVKWALGAFVVAALLAAGAGGVLFLVKIRGLEESVADASRPAPALAASKAPVQEAPRPIFTLELPGLPAGAQVFVDGTLHPERPVLIEGDPGTRTILVLAEGRETWQERVSVTSDLSLTVTLSPAPADVQYGVKEPAKKSGGKRKKKPRIDTDYPGLL